MCVCVCVCVCVYIDIQIQTKLFQQNSIIPSNVPTLTYTDADVNAFFHLTEFYSTHTVYIVARVYSTHTSQSFIVHIQYT